MPNDECSEADCGHRQNGARQTPISSPQPEQGQREQASPQMNSGRAFERFQSRQRSELKSIEHVEYQQSACRQEFYGERSGSEATYVAFNYGYYKRHE